MHTTTATKSSLLAVVESYEGMILLGGAPAWVYEAWTVAKARLAAFGK